MNNYFFFPNKSNPTPNNSNIGQTTKPIIVPSILAHFTVITLWFHIVRKFTAKRITATVIKIQPALLFLVNLFSFIREMTITQIIF